MRRIVGLEIDADDFVVKPCNPRELLAPVKDVLSGVAVVADQQNVGSPILEPSTGCLNCRSRYLFTISFALASATLTTALSTFAIGPGHHAASAAVAKPKINATLEQIILAFMRAFPDSKPNLIRPVCKPSLSGTCLRNVPPGGKFLTSCVTGESCDAFLQIPRDTAVR
jgi:hypothetical protein